MAALRARLGGEAGIGLVEAVIAMTLFLVVSTGISGVLTSSVNSHGFTHNQTLGQEAADAQIEFIRALPYDSVGTTGGNPPGSVSATEAASVVGVSGLPATITSSIHFVGDGIPNGYNQLTNYKDVVVTVTLNTDGEQLATESTYIAPPTRAPYGGINQVALGVIVTDIGDNQPVPDVPIALQTGPSAPRSDTTDTNGGVLFAGMTANPTSGPTSSYNIIPTIPPGFAEMPGDVKTAQLGPGQLTNLSLRLYQPATIYAHLTSGASDYTGSATVTVTPSSGSPQTYPVNGASNGTYSITGLLPNAQYTVSASTAAGALISPAIAQTVPNNYPTDLTSTYNLPLAPPNGTLSITAMNSGTPIPGVAITVTGGPSGVTLNGTTDSSGVANFPTIPAGSAPYVVTGVLGAATFQQTGVTVSANTPTPIILGVLAGSVKVTVNDGANPVKGATVTLVGPNSFSAVGTTDGSGTFTFTNVGTGTGYAVTATDGAATAQASGVTVNTGAATNLLLSVSVGTVKTTVTDGTNPLANIPVTLTGPNGLTIIGTTNASGVYSFTQIGAGGGYSVSAANGAATTQATGQTVVSAATTNVSLTLPAGTIAATVTEGGTPVAGAKVTVNGPNGYSATQTANASGVATFTGVGAGSGYSVSSGDGPATVQQSGVSVTGGSSTPVALAVPIGSLQVTVSAGTVKLSGVTVALTGANSYTHAPGTTDATGVYTFTNVPAGAGFTVKATTAGGSAQVAPVTVVGSTTTPVAVSMPVGSLKVTVTVAGNPITGQAVTLTGPNSFSAGGTTDTNGVFTFTNVPPGTGYIVATTYGSAVQVTNQTVATGATTNVALTVPSNSLIVTVKNGSGTVLPGVAVTLASTNSITSPAGVTPANGMWTFPALPYGTGYTVTAKEGAETVTSTAQTIGSGGSTNLTLTFPANSIQVTAKNAAGTVQTGIPLTLSGPNGYAAAGTTNGSGIYTFTLVPSGSGYSVNSLYGAENVTVNSVTVSSTAGTTTNVNLPFLTGTITMTVKRGGGCSTRSGVVLTMVGPNSYGTTATSNGSGIATFSNVPANGTYTVSGPSGGNYVDVTAPVTSGGNTAKTISNNNCP